MNQHNYFSILCIISLILFSQHSNSFEKGRVTIEATIIGLQIGDEIIIEQISLPDWNKSTSDTIHITALDKFKYNTILDHTTLMMITHQPNNRAEIINDTSGKILFTKPFDKLTITGDEKHISSLHIAGGSYDTPYVKKLQEISNKHDSISSDLYRKIEALEKTQNNDSIKTYRKIYNTHRRNNQSKIQEQYIINHINDDEFSPYLYLQELYDEPYSKVTERLSKYTPQIQESYMGQQLYKMCKILKNIEVGNTPPDFTLIDSHKNKIRLSDYRGKYVLIYHWGVWCPGTQWVHPQIDELYKKYNSKGLDVIGLSIDKMILKDPLPNLSPELTKQLYNQPWVTIFTDDAENKFITDEYYFSGVPILMLISPEGKTLVRGYSESIKQVKEVLDNNLDVKL